MTDQEFVSHLSAAVGKLSRDLPVNKTQSDIAEAYRCEIEARIQRQTTFVDGMVDRFNNASDLSEEEAKSIRFNVNNTYDVQMRFKLYRWLFRFVLATFEIDTLLKAVNHLKMYERWQDSLLFVNRELNQLTSMLKTIRENLWQIIADVEFRQLLRNSDFALAKDAYDNCIKLTVEIHIFMAKTQRMQGRGDGTE